MELMWLSDLTIDGILSEEERSGGGGVHLGGD